MKNICKIMFIFILVFLLTGCNKPSKDENLSEYAKELNDYMEGAIPDVMTAGFDIPLEFNFSDGSYATLTWTSLSTNSVGISKKGKVSYLTPLFDNVSKVKCEIEIDGNVVDTCEYEINVKGNMTKEEYVEEFKRLYLPDSVYKTIELTYLEDKIFYNRKIEGTIEYNSKNEDVFSSTGEYKNQSPTDTTVAFGFTVSINGFVVSGEKNIIVEGKNNIQAVEHAAEWLENTWKTDIVVKDNIDFPKTDDAGKVEFEWESNNKTIVDDSGKIVNYCVNQEVVFTATIKLNDYSLTKEVRVMTISKDEAIKYIMDKMHKDEYFQSYFYTYVVASGHPNEDFGMLNFYTEDLNEASLVLSEKSTGYTYAKNTYNTNVSEGSFRLMMIPTNLAKRPGTKRNVEFITIHDTGDAVFNAAQWGNEVTTSDREVSWHFTVDDKEIIQHMPLDEVAWHAGDGGRPFGLTDTGVKYTVSDPEIVVNPSDGFFYINGQKSYLKAPLATDGKYYTDITPAGLYTEMGKNGNYFMNNYYYNSTYKKISNAGGFQAIGIESCIQNGVKYSRVQKKYANLVAHLLNVYNLDLSRVLQHRNFSGKYCPQSMIRVYEKGEMTQFNYEYFKEMIEIELFIIKNLPDLKVTYTSNNKDILTDEGQILKYVDKDTSVSYTVSASCGSVNYTNTYTTVIHPKK